MAMLNNQRVYFVAWTPMISWFNFFVQVKSLILVVQILCIALPNLTEEY